MFPILIAQIGEKRCCRSAISQFLTTARGEVAAQERAYATEYQHYFRRSRSRSERSAANAYFEAYLASLLFAVEALNGMEKYLRSQKHAVLREALADYHSHEVAYRQILRVRISLPALVEEDIQRAA